MTRDMDLIRAILLEMERHASALATYELKAPGYSPEQISYHVKLLAEAGLIEAEDVSTFSDFHWMPRSLRWAGHEFLDAARNDTVWHKVKAQLKDKGISLPLTLVQQLAIKIAGSAFGL